MLRYLSGLGAKDGQARAFEVRPSGEVYICTVYNDNITLAAKKTCHSLVRRGWAERKPGPYPLYELNAEGMEMARTLPEPEWTPPPSLLKVPDEEDWQILCSLAHFKEHEERIHEVGARPMDVGGHDGSDHSGRLFRLACLGLVELKFMVAWRSGPEVYPKPRLGKGGRGSRRFRITEAGMEAVREHKEALRRERGGEVER
jgi:hypothetical protein